MRNLRIAATKSGGRSRSSSRRRNVSFGSRFDATMRAPRSPRRLPAPRRARARRAPGPCATGALVRISAPLRARRSRDRFRHRAHAAAHEAPQAAMPADAAHAVVQQDVGRARRARAAVGADHAVGGERDLHLRRFEPLVQEIGRALREDLDQRRRCPCRLRPRSVRRACR